MAVVVVVFCGGLNLVDIYIPVHDGIDSQGGDALHAELLHDVLAMGDDRGQTNVQLVGNLLVDITLHDERQHFYLAVGEHLCPQGTGHRRQVLSTCMGLMTQHQQ